MKVHRTLLGCLPCLLAVPLLAQPQIGGGSCTSASLTGAYSATLTGRDLNSATFTSASHSVGSATFDGLSKVTFTLLNNSSKLFGVSQTLSGTYSLQANCIGVVSITSGDTASFTLEAYNQGRNYLMTGQDGASAFTGSGNLLPATCPTTIPAGSYSYNGTGFGLGSGAITSVFNISAIITFSGTNSITLTEYLTSATGPKTASVTGTYTVMPNCVATATALDTVGNAYNLTFELTSGTGENFSMISSSPAKR